MPQKITLNHVCKVEGHGSLYVEIDKGKIMKCELGSVEGARYFEGLVQGKHFSQIKEITSRICGICSCAHTICSIKAVEDAFGVKVSEQVEVLRDLLTIGERIRSHATHLYLLALPDYLGYESAIAMAPNYKKEVARALELVKLGNTIVEIVGGREMHPVTPVVGGFTKIISKEDQEKLLKWLKQMKEDARITANLFLNIKYPKFERQTDYVSLKQIDEFPLIRGKVVSLNGMDIEQRDYLNHLKEYIEEHSSAKFSVKKGKSYYTGALARINTNLKLLSRDTEQVMKQSRIKFPSYNPFHNNAAQALELLHWIDQGIRILEKYEFKPEPVLEVKPKKGRGVAAVEAPRGILFHDYTFDENGNMVKANIVTPTAQSLRNMEEDIKEYLKKILSKPRKEIVMEIEKLIRAYDPCFSCSTHFLDVTWKET
ncbi:MAG: Ni/Fe hydrogenase subunit alpha [archaeon]